MGSGIIPASSGIHPIEPLLELICAKLRQVVSPASAASSVNPHKISDIKPQVS